MKITSKYPGTCDICGERFDVGDEIDWAKVDGDNVCSHWSCHVDDKQNAASPIKPAQKGATVTKVPMSMISQEDREKIVKSVMKEIVDRITVAGQCRILSAPDTCECAKCQIGRLDIKAVTDMVFF